MSSNWWPHCSVVLISQFFPTLTETYALFLASISQLPQRSFTRNYIQDFVMVKQPSPDRRLVYTAHQFSAEQTRRFDGQRRSLGFFNSIRHPSKSLQRNSPCSHSVAKELLEEQIFESLPRAKLRFPELFQPSETQEAERAASEAEVVKIEAEAAQDIVLTSDDDGGDECLDYEQGEQRAEPAEILEDKNETPDNVQISAVELRQVSFRG